MNVIRATTLGMCFGVRDALQVANSIDDADRVTIQGQLVHNPMVLHQLDHRGFRQTPEAECRTIPDTPRVLITAHGTSDRQREWLVQAGKQLIDTTCPLVRYVHQSAQNLQQEGRHILLIGKSGHVEVRGIVDDLTSFDVIERAEDVIEYSSKRLGIISQTTVPPQVADEICVHIQLHNPLADIKRLDTICQPTKQRQQAVLELTDMVDAVVVVGGKNSNNTRQLVELCLQRQTPALHVENANDLDATWFIDVETVGLTAGTSTQNETISEVHEALLKL